MTEMQRDVNDIKKILDEITTGFLFMGVSKYEKNVFMTSFSDNISGVIDAVSSGAEEEDLFIYMSCAFAVKKNPDILKQIKRFESTHGTKALYETLKDVIETSEIENGLLGLSFAINQRLQYEQQ
jgi:hypothetical protein